MCYVFAVKIVQGFHSLRYSKIILIEGNVCGVFTAKIEHGVHS
jgi:hypothetical protein